MITIVLYNNTLILHIYVQYFCKIPLGRNLNNFRFQYLHRLDILTIYQHANVVYCTPMGPMRFNVTESRAESGVSSLFMYIVRGVTKMSSLKRFIMRGTAMFRLRSARSVDVYLIQ